MKQIITYITEKLHINKDTGKDKDPYDPDYWNVGDIIVFYGFRVEFYKIIKRTPKKFDLQELGTKLISGYYNSAEYKAVPANLDEENSDIFKNCGFNKYDDFIIDGYKGQAKLWDGNPVTGHGNLY